MPVEAGHPDVEEDGVDRLGRRAARSASVAASVAVRTSPIRGSLREQEGQLVQGRRLVVDDEHAQSGAHRGSDGVTSSSHGARDSGANLGTRTLTLVPAPGGGLDDQAVVVAEDLAQPRVDVGQARRESPSALAGERRARIALGVRADAVVLDGDHGLGARVARRRS